MLTSIHLSSFSLRKMVPAELVLCITARLSSWKDTDTYTYTYTGVFMCKHMCISICYNMYVYTHKDWLTYCLVGYFPPVVLYALSLLLYPRPRRGLRPPYPHLATPATGLLGKVGGAGRGGEGGSYGTPGGTLDPGWVCIGRTSRGGDLTKSSPPPSFGTPLGAAPGFGVAPAPGPMAPVTLASPLPPPPPHHLKGGVLSRGGKVGRV